MVFLRCLAPRCECTFKSGKGLAQHWSARHAWELGNLRSYRDQLQTSEQSQGVIVDEEGGSSCEDSAAEEELVLEQQASVRTDMLRNYVGHMDKMKFQFFQTDAEVQRAKEMTQCVVADIRRAVINALQALAPTSVLEEMLGPIMSAIDEVHTVKREAAFRRREERVGGLPRLKVYPRELCVRDKLTSAATSRRARKRGYNDVAVAYETKLEEVIEREIAYDPQLLEEILLSDMEWTRRNTLRQDLRDESHSFQDVCDGAVWAEHPYLGDPKYQGPPRLAFLGYCDDVDIPNPIGPHAGDHKLFLSYLVLLNKAPGNRMRLASVILASVCLAADAKLAGPAELISGPVDESADSTSIGANFRRRPTAGTLVPGRLMVPAYGRHLGDWAPHGAPFPPRCRRRQIIRNKYVFWSSV
mmetsp:Transcript_16372/g.24703  ORF Transcript_16372/g.24703 Transcript_16372/m.24703 type:complete len:414 (-) Transcript_16372:119-1360(-)